MTKRWASYEDVPLEKESAPDIFVDYFYPIHFSIGMRIEKGLTVDGLLDRHQTAIMWTLRSEALLRGEMAISRKMIVQYMTNWYDITNSGVSRALRSLSKDPLNFIVVEDAPKSAREKVVRLTDKGVKHCDDMIESAREVIIPFIENLSTQEGKMTIFCFKRLEEECSKLRT